MRLLLALMLPVICLAVPARTEVIHFKNGDRLTGDWQRVERGKLILKTEALGEVAIPLTWLESFTTTKRAVASLRNGQVLRGELTMLPSGAWQVRTGRGVRMVAPRDVEAIYPQSVHEPRTPEHTFSTWLNWRGTGSLGYSLVRGGDRQAGTFNAALNATRGQPDLAGLVEPWRTTVNFTMLFAHTQTNSGLRISANSVTSLLRQDFLFTPNNFVFGLVTFEHIQPQNVDFRQTYGLGIGRDVVRRPRVAASFLGGTTLVKERIQTGLRRQNSESLFGEKLSLGLSDQVNLTHQFSFYPNLSDTGQFRFDTTSVLSTRLTSRLSLNVNLIDRYLSLPVPGRKKNELVVTTGFGLRF